MTTLQILKAARALLSDRAKWTTGAFGRTCAGELLGGNLADAVCYCLVGALIVAAGGFCEVVINEACAALGFNHHHQAQDWNDAPGRTHAEVLARFDGAIMRLEVQS